MLGASERAAASSHSDANSCQFEGFRFLSGDISITNAQPFPNTKQQCENGGWKGYTDFKNQGQCVRFVRPQSRQECIIERAAHGVAAFRAKCGQGADKRYAMRSCVRLRVNS